MRIDDMLVCADTNDVCISFLCPALGGLDNNNDNSKEAVYVGSVLHVCVCVLLTA
jgi:hypothetical protein